MSGEERPEPPRDPVKFAADVARELEHIAQKGFLRTPAGDFFCTPRGQARARKAAPRWWRTAEIHAERAWGAR